MSAVENNHSALAHIKFEIQSVSRWMLRGEKSANPSNLQKLVGAALCGYPRRLD